MSNCRVEMSATSLLQKSLSSCSMLSSLVISWVVSMSMVSVESLSLSSNTSRTESGDASRSCLGFFWLAICFGGSPAKRINDNPSIRRVQLQCLSAVCNVCVTVTFT